MFENFECCVYKREQTAPCLGFPPGILGLTVRQTVKTNLTRMRSLKGERPRGRDVG